MLLEADVVTNRKAIRRRMQLIGRQRSALGHYPAKRTLVVSQLIPPFTVAAQIIAKEAETTTTQRPTIAAL
jgi:hypothetical protein